MWPSAKGVTGWRWRAESLAATQDNVGAGLLAKAAYQLTSKLNDTPLSRASRIVAPPLPQFYCVIAESAFGQCHPLTHDRCPFCVLQLHATLEKQVHVVVTLANGLAQFHLQGFARVGARQCADD